MGGTRRKSSAVPFAPLNVANSLFERTQPVVESISPAQRDSTEADLERMGVRVEQSYSVRTARD